MTSLVRFFHPFARKYVTRVLCASHHATARAMLTDVLALDPSFRECDWCEAIGSRRDSRLRDIVSREVGGPQLVEVPA